MKKHFYALVFNTVTKNKQSFQTCIYISGDVNAVTKGSIQLAKDAAKLKENSVLISASYLGFMTEEDFNA